MKIYRDYNNSFYMKDNLALGNCITIEDKNEKYYYEFEINRDKALVKYNSILHIKDAINEFRKYNMQVSIYYNSDRSFYMAFDNIQTFKLPIDILQPSKFFIDKEKLETIEKHLGNELLVVPVCIIDDEYVLLDGHARCRYLLDNDYKMVDVYMAPEESSTKEYVYIAKENNLFKIKNMEILSHEDYLKYLEQTGNER